MCAYQCETRRVLLREGVEYAPWLRLDAVEEADDRIGRDVALLDRGGKADEAKEALRELVRLGALEAREEEDKDGARHVLLEGRQREELDERFEEVEPVLVGRLGLDQVLEDAEHGRHLPSCDDLIRAAAEESAQESHERGDVAPALPERRREQGREEDFVRVGHVGGWVELEELGEDLEDKGGELRDVLLEDGVEGREEGGFEVREGRGVASGDEAAMTSV